MKIAIALVPAAAVAGCVLYVNVLHGSNVGPGGKLVLEAECATFVRASRFLTVELWMRDIVNTNVDGLQAFIEFDVNDLTYRGDLSSYTNVPFPRPNRSPMDIADAAADSQGMPHPGLLEVSGFAAWIPTNLDSLLATFVFEVNGPECGPAGLTGQVARTTTLNLVDVDQHRVMRYTRLASDGIAITTIPVGVVDIGLDGTPPQITVPDDVVVHAPVSLLGTVVVDLGTATASDNCSTPVIVCSRDDGAPCDAPFPVGVTTVTWTATDDCGHETSESQVVVVLNGGFACGEGDCCWNNGSAGCDDGDCCNAVCDTMPDCCLVTWDFDCAALALQVCDVCGSDDGDCCRENGTPGCEDAECTNIVCDSMPQCCLSVWDAGCGAAALLMCSAVCGDTNDGDCCTNNGSAGCDDDQCTAAVCDIDMMPECCLVTWDFNCAALALQICDACTSPCGLPDAGDCCSANGSRGCDDLDCCKLVCESDPFCCESDWDFDCAASALLLCDDCISPCGLPDTGDCCTNNGSPGCEDIDCCKLVCETIPSCCETGWDSQCANAAQTMCDCPQPCPPPVVTCSAEFVSNGDDDDDDDDGSNFGGGSVGSSGLGMALNNRADSFRTRNTGIAPARLWDDPSIVQFLFLLESNDAVSPTRSAGVGVAFMTLNLHTRELTWDVNYQMLSSSLIAARFHAPGTDGANADIQISLSAPTIEVPGTGKIVGSTVITTEQAVSLVAGRWTLDLSTQDNPAGEVSGKAMPTPPAAGSCTVRVSWTIVTECAGSVDAVVRNNGNTIPVTNGQVIEIDCTQGDANLQVTFTNSGGEDSCMEELCHLCSTGDDDNDDSGH